MSIVHSTHVIDAPFAQAYEGRTDMLVELGLGGWGAAELPGSAAISAWIPGHDPDAARAALNQWQRERRALRFLFPEHLHAPSVEARRLLLNKDLGHPAHVLVRVQAHPGRLLYPDQWQSPQGWLREPALNRLPFLIWFLGPVREARVVSSIRKGALSVVVSLRHERAPRLSILEITVSNELTQANAPAIRDSIECTGSDGFVRVGGIWNEQDFSPRLHLHRGGKEILARKLRRDFGQIYESAAVQAPLIARESKASWQLAEEYLHACELVLAQVAQNHAA